MPARTFLSRACLVFLGGTLGTLLRALLTLPAHDTSEPWIVAAINIVGAGLLGALMGALAARQDARAERLRALWGVGLLGGFTSYSALSLHTVTLGATGTPGLAVLYSAGTLIVGALATLAGIVLAHRFTQRARS